MKALRKNRKRSWPRPIPIGCAVLAATCAGNLCLADQEELYWRADQRVMLDHGPPTDNVYELRPGERAHPWCNDKIEFIAGSSSGEVCQTRRGERYEVTETRGYVPVRIGM